MDNRQIKMALGAAVALYVTIVCFNNIFDYPSNFFFVRMITKMDDIFSKERNGWRAITSETLHHVVYIFIILWELVIAGILWAGFFSMLSKRDGGNTEFKKAKKLTSLGLALGIVLWFAGFVTIAGEWFLMWQSKNYNAQTTAFFLSATFLLFLIYHNQDDN